MEGFEIKKLKLNLILIFILFFSILLVNTVYADAIDDNQTAIDDDFDSIQNLIDNAQAGESIHLQSKTYLGNGSSIKINKDVSIYGADDYDTVLDGNGESNIFVIGKNVNVNIFGITFINGKTTLAGGAINNDGNLTIFNSKFSDNNAYSYAKGREYGDGGAINNNGNLMVFDSEFNDNFAYNGGAIRGSQNSKITSENCLFDNNVASSSGAAIDTYLSDSQIINCTFMNNRCNEGGAIYNRFSDFYLINSTFITNVATRGGGIYNNRGYLVVNNSKFISNSASHLGGGVKSWGVCEMSNSYFEDNYGEYGGGAYISEYYMTVRNCTFVNNHAVCGGGIVADSLGHLDIRNSTLFNNSAELGGGVGSSFGYITLDDCILSNNHATQGGGFACDSTYEFNITNAIFYENTAKQGGGLYISKVNVNFSNLTFNSNSASIGGAIYNTGNSILSNSNICNNHAPNGGGIYNAKGSFTLINSNVYYNTADNGAGIYNVAQFNCDNVTAESNNAKGYGGFAYNNNNLKLVNSNLNSNQADFAGVIYNNNVVSIDNSSFSQNRANEGAVINNRANISMANSKFLNNEVLHTHGIIYTVDGIMNIDSCLFESNKGSDEGGVIFNGDTAILISDSKFVSNSAVSYGGAIDNAGEMTIINSLFDKNQAYGAGAIDNGGTLQIIRSNFTDNRATKNGGAIDNNNLLDIVGSVFENNAAGGEGGAIIARNDFNVSHSSLYNNQASVGNAIYANNQNSNLTNNWWGTNQPDFKKLFNFNIPDRFDWIIMEFKNSSRLIQYENADIEISLLNVINDKGSISKLEKPELLPDFKVSLSNGSELNFNEGYLSKSITVPKESSISFTLNNQSYAFKTLTNPSKIKNNKNIVVDYKGKVTFKVRVYGIGGKTVGKDEIVIMRVSGNGYNVKTDSKGYASKTFSLTPGKYTITTIYKGSTVKNTITIKKVLKASSKTVKKAKKIKYSAFLKTSKGKAISGKKITFKVNGQTYSAKTNKKGVATVSFKNLKVKKYSVIVKYLNSQVKTTLNVKK